MLLDKQPEQGEKNPASFTSGRQLQLERNHLKLAFMQWENLAYLTGLGAETTIQAQVSAER